MTLLSRHLLIDGRVQGVGFRWAFATEARKLGLTGWVRNRDDGQVEAIICGDRTSVEQMTVWAHHGPSSARVDQLLQNDLPDGSCQEEKFKVISTW